MKIRLKNITLLTLISLMSVSIIYSQSGNITISSVDGCEGDYINIPIHGDNLSNIGAITFYIDYNPLTMEFDTMSYVNPLLSGLIYNDIPQTPGTFPGGKIGISWSGFSPVNIVNDNLLTLSFHFLGINDSIVFSDNNEVADFDANILPVNLLNGDINLTQEISIDIQPEDLTMYIDEIGDFTVEGSSITDYIWEYNVDGNWIEIPELIFFSGQYSRTLVVTHPDMYLNERYFRCHLLGCNSTYSDSVQLIIQPSSIYENNISNKFKIYPIPTNNQITIEGNKLVPGKYEINILDTYFRQIKSIKTEIMFDASLCETINFSNYPSGTYFIEIESKVEGIKYQLEKIILYK